MKITPHVSFNSTSRGSSEAMGFWRFVSVPVVVVLLIIGFVYHTIVVLVIQPWLNISTTSGFANVALLTVLCTMALLSYTLAVVRDPGYIPSSYLPDPEDEGVALQEVKRKVFPVPFFTFSQIKLVTSLQVVRLLGYLDVDLPAIFPCFVFPILYSNLKAVNISVSLY